MTYYDIAEPDNRPIEELLALLPEWRREKALLYKFERGRRECASAYLLLCRMLRDRFGIDEMPQFRIGEHGKPSLLFTGKALQERRLRFNISHCPKAVACIVSDDCEVGIDIERCGRYKDSLARYCMSEQEMQMITDGQDHDRRFTRLWTQKEALLKLTGEGITDDLKTVLDSERMTGVRLDSFYDEASDCMYSVAYKRL